jgi:predicted glycoside hydrolase/deacetylase ChbG (UPF0249 family)
VESVTIVLLITLLLILVLFILPEVWRRMARSSIARRDEINASLAEIGSLLRDSADRLRPFRDLQADLFRSHYQPAREKLQQAIDHYREVATRLSQMTVYGVHDGAWAFPHFLDHPEDAINIPRTFVQLRSLEQEVEQVRQELAEAEEAIAATEETPATLHQSASELAQNRVPVLAQDLLQEEQAGIVALGDLPQRLEDLQEQAGDLDRRVRQRPPAELMQMDPQAQELVRLQQTTASLEDEVSALRQRREALDQRLQTLEDNTVQIHTNATDDSIRTGLEPLLDYARGRLDRAREQRRDARFDEAQTTLSEAETVLELARHLSLAAEQVRQLLDVADISLQADAIDVLSRRLYTAFRAAYALTGIQTEPEHSPPGTPPPGDTPPETIPTTPGQDRRDALEGLQLRVERLADEAARLQREHQESVEEMEQLSNTQAAELAQAWQALQKVVTLPQDDPVAQHYRQLLQQKSRAEGNPIRQQTFVQDARATTTQLEEAAQSLKRGLERVEALRGELPDLLQQAEKEAGNWRSLQPYVQEMKESTATIWQITASGVHLSEMQEILAELDLLEEQARAAYAALSGEKRLLDVWQRRIEQAHNQPVDRPINPAEQRHLDKMVESQLTTARAAPTTSQARANLQEALALLESEPDGGRPGTVDDGRRTADRGPRTADGGR